MLFQIMADPPSLDDVPPLVRRLVMQVVTVVFVDAGEFSNQ